MSSCSSTGTLTCFGLTNTCSKRRFSLHLLVRADAGPEIGAGHLMRCLALVQALQDRGGSALFAMSASAEALEARVVAEGALASRLTCATATGQDMEQTARLGRDIDADWGVLDG